MRLRELHDRAAPAGVFLIVWACYLCSAPSAVMMEDDGLFVLAAYFNGVAHPPGYPLYTLLGKLATLVPFGSVAWRVHALSGLFGALSCACLWWLGRQWLAARSHAWLAALALGLSPVFWSQSIIAEVYTLNVFLTLLLVLLCWRLAYLPLASAVRLLPWLGFVYGLALSNHWPLLLLSTLGGLLLLLPRCRVLLAHCWRAVLGLLLGLLPYAWMVWRSLQDPVISFYGPLDSWERFWFMVSRSGYANVDDNPASGWRDKFQFMGFLLVECGRQFSWFGGALVLWGFVRQWRVWPRHLCWGLSAIFLGNTLLLALLLGFNYDLRHQFIFRVYPLSAWSMAALWLAVGAAGLGEFLAGWRSRWLSQRGLSGFLAGMLLWMFADRVGDNYRANERWTTDYAELVLRGLPDGAHFFGVDESLFAPLLYQNLVSGTRPDLTLHLANGLVLGNRIFDPRQVTSHTAATRWEAFVEALSAPVYFLPGSDLESERWGVDDFGWYLRLRKDYPQGARAAKIATDTPAWQALLDRQTAPAFSPEGMYGRVLSNSLCEVQVSTRGVFFGEALGFGDIARLEQQVCRYYKGKLILLNALLQQERLDYAVLDGLLQRAAALRRDSLTKLEESYFELLLGEYLLSQGRRAAAVAAFTRADRLWSYPDNQAAPRLAKLSSERRAYQNFIGGR